MLLGEYEHTIDDKSRLTLPARFRQAFTEGVVVSRGLDGCLYAYPRADWTRAIEARLAADLQGRGKLIAIDRDPTARSYFARFEKSAGVQARLLRGDFGVVLGQLAENEVRADAILLDLGVSSMQLDRPERGFSYSVDAPL